MSSRSRQYDVTCIFHLLLASTHKLIHTPTKPNEEKDQDQARSNLSPLTTIPFHRYILARINVNFLLLEHIYVKSLDQPVSHTSNSIMDALRGSSPAKNGAGCESPEQLLDSFKAAALSVTKLYKTSVAAQTKARADGYQDCLDDLLAFLDKSNIGVSDGEGWLIRKWATERLDGRDISPQTVESEDEVEKPEPASSPEIHHSGNQTHLSAMRNEPHLQTESAPASIHQSTINSPAGEQQMISVPTQDSFTFRASHPYPQEPYLNLENLDLSDSTRTNDGASPGSSAVPIAHPTRSRTNKRGPRPRPTNHLGKGAGQKRTINFAELFNVGDIPFGKDMFGREGKRSRHN